MTLRIIGVDFTSAPRRAKPIVCSVCALEGRRLHLDALVEFVDMAAFENFLSQPGPWVAGMDLPFSQPRALVEALGWPLEWPALVAHLGELGLDAFAEQLAGFRDAQPKGQKQLKRRCDDLAGAQSPMMLHGVPVARMFLAAAPRLLAAGVSVPPCHAGDAERVAVETYPALLVRELIGKVSYKADTTARQTAKRAEARVGLIEALASEALAEAYDIELGLPDGLAEELRDDATGDRLDAVLCAVQAAWSQRSESPRFGIPEDADPLEGWICDPALLRGAA